MILLGVILAIGAGLVIWKSNVGHAGGTFSSISKQEVEMLLADIAKSNPAVLKRFKEDPNIKKDQLNNLKELLAFATQAQKEGLANESPNKEELQNVRREITAVTYDREINKDKGPMPPFGFITEEQVKAFWGEGQPEKGFFENLKDKIGLGAKDHELEFTKFLDSKVAILKRDNPQMADREISEEEKTQAREFFAKIGIYNDEYAAKVRSGEISKELQDKIELQVKLQQAQFLARLYAEKMPEKIKVTDADIAKYLADHPELDPAAKKTKAEEILTRVKNGEDFAALAKEFSEDPGSKEKGGLYEDIRMGQMVKPFEDGALSVQPGELVPTLVETDFGYHIIKLEGKKAAPAEGAKEEEPAVPGMPPAPASGETYTARHILISTGVKDPENPMGREEPVKRFVTRKLEEERQKKLIEEIVASNHVTVPEDFDVPEVSEEQIQESMRQRQEQMQMPEGDDGHGHEGPPAASNSAKPAANTAKPAAPKK